MLTDTYMNRWTEGSSKGLVGVSSSHIKTVDRGSCELHCSEMVTSELSLMSEVSRRVTTTNSKVNMGALTCQNW